MFLYLLAAALQLAKNQMKPREKTVMECILRWWNMARAQLRWKGASGAFAEFGGVLNAQDLELSVGGSSVPKFKRYLKVSADLTPQSLQSSNCRTYKQHRNRITSFQSTNTKLDPTRLLGAATYRTEGAAFAGFAYLVLTTLVPHAALSWSLHLLHQSEMDHPAKHAFCVFRVQALRSSFATWRQDATEILSLKTTRSSSTL